MQEQADQVAAGGRGSQPSRRLPLVLQAGSGALPQAGADGLQRLARGGHVVGHPAAEQPCGAAVEDAAAEGGRFQQPLPPGAQRQPCPPALALRRQRRRLRPIDPRPALREFAHRIDESPAPSLPCVEPAVAEDHLQGALQADDARQPLRAAPGRDQAELNLGEAELRPRVVDGEAVIAGQGQLQAAAQAGAADHRHGRQAQVGQLGEELLPRGGQRLGLRGTADGSEFVNIGAGHEPVGALAGEDQNARARLGGDGVQGGVEVGEDAAVEDVDAAPGGVQPEDGGAFGLPLDVQVFRLKKQPRAGRTALHQATPVARSFGRLETTRPAEGIRGP